MTNLDFYCNKRFDITFSDFHKLIKVVLPSDYTTYETRGLYRNDYQPCNIIELRKDDEIKANIYCWLGQKGLTVLANTELAVSLCTEVLKNIKQNPEEYKVLSYPLIDKQLIIDKLKDYLVYQQINSTEDTDKLIVREFNGDEVAIDFYHNPDDLRVSGAESSLFTLIKLIIAKHLGNPENI